MTFILMFLVGLGISTVTFQLKRKMEQVSVLGVERIKLKSAAEKEQLKATLLRSISHDLRMPLTTIKNGAELLLDNPRLEEGIRKKFSGISFRNPTGRSGSSKICFLSRGSTAKN